MTFNFDLKKIGTHLLVILGFVVAALAYFSPVIKGDKILQSDIVHYRGMARQQTDFRAANQTEPYWTDSAFGGMPTYQLGAQYPHYYVKYLDRALRFLPRPADYLFLYFLGCYLLLLVLKVDYRLACIGSLAFGFSTYFIIILGVGHNAKAHAIGYIPMVISGVLLTFQRKKILGFLLLTMAMALELVANHIQMTYYLSILIAILGIAYGVAAYRQEKWRDYLQSIGIMLGAVLLAVMLNSTHLLATKEYAAESTRGQSALSITPDGTSKTTSGLDYAYITEYSYGILESFNLFIPRFMGGSSGEPLGTDAESYQELLKMGASPGQARSFVRSAPTYWGDQTFVGAPAYLGAGILFLFVLALFLVKGPPKWWLLGGTLVSLALSWGDHFSILTRFFVNWVPLYNKFRAVSSIQVLLELCVPVMAILGLQQLLQSTVVKEKKFTALKYSTAILGGLALMFLMFKDILFDFSGGSDVMLNQQMGSNFVRALRADRKAIFTADTMRSLIIILLIASGIWFYLQDKFKQKLLLIGLGIVVVLDLVLINRRYVNADNFVSAMAFNTPFQPNSADLEILEDKGHFRVYDVTQSPFNTGKTAYFHNALGGYHAAKPGRIQDLYDFYLSKGNTAVLNMFNTKYLIVNEKEGIKALQNPDANGNAWFVDSLHIARTQDDELRALQALNTKKKAVIGGKDAPSLSRHSFVSDSTTTLQLIGHQPNKLTYTSKNTQPGFAVFSEVFYPHGWQAYLDGKTVPHWRVNYTLRGMEIPAGDHTIVFKFEPEVVKTGSSITLASTVLFVGLVLGGLYYEFRNAKNKI